MDIFNNKSVNYYYNSVMDNSMYEIDNILNIKHNLNKNFTIIKLEFGNLFINRKTLENSFNNNITARCELVKNKESFLIYCKKEKEN